MRRHRRIGAGIAAAVIQLTSALPTCAQTKLSGPVQIEGRAAELNQISEQLADPDSTRRLATIMTIVESGDATRIDFALRIALVSDDPSVRGLALRAYMANRKVLDLDIVSPPEIQRRLDGAQNDPQALKEIVLQYPYLEYVQQTGFRLHLQLANYSMSRSTGTGTAGRGNGFTFSVSGDRITGSGFLIAPDCSFDLRPVRVVKGGSPLLSGNMSCPSGWPPAH